MSSVNSIRARFAVLVAFALAACGSCAFSEEGKRFPRSGINAGWQDFSVATTALPFANVIRNASHWHGAGFELNEDGYPLELVEGQEATLFLFKDNGRHYPLGEYTLYWEGEGDIEIRSAGRSIRFGAGDEKLQAVSIEEHSDYGIQIALTNVSEENPIRRLEFYLPGYDRSSGLWTDHYIEDLKPYGVVRFMWGSAAWSYLEVEKWEERKRLDTYNWLGGDEDRGIPYEAMIELANRTGNDLWVCAPHGADEDFMRSMAELFRDNLDDSLSFWIEYTNEHWLDIDFFKIPPNDYLQEELERNKDNPDYEGLTVSRLYARKALKLLEVFTEVFAETDESDRLVRVVCGSAGWAEPLRELADEIDRLGKMELVDAMGVGPYLWTRESDDSFEKALDKGWDAIFKSVHGSIDDMFDPKGERGSELHANAAIAVKYSKPLVAYEGGQHFTTWTNTPSEIIAPMNRRPEMYSVYERFLEGWESLPNASTFVFFQAVSLYDEHEAFGLREYYDQDPSELHKRRAVMEWIEGSEL